MPFSSRDPSAAEVRGGGSAGGPGPQGRMPVEVSGPTKRHLGELEGGADDSDSEWRGRMEKIR